MLGFDKRTSTLERRLKELQREQLLIQGDIKSLSKAVKRGAAINELPGLRQAGAKSQPATEASAPRPEPPASAGAGSRGHTLAVGPFRNRAPADQGLIPYSMRGSSNPRFASYFSAGSIVPARPLRQEKSVQRNKAIFMVVIVLIVAFVVVKLVS